MSIDIRWFDRTHKIVCVEMRDSWTVDEFTYAVGMTCKLIEAQPDDVHLIVDFSQQAQPPSQLLMVLRGIGNRLPANLGAVAFVNADPFTAALLRVIAPSLPEITQRATFTASVKAAHHFVTGRHARFSLAGD